MISFLRSLFGSSASDAPGPSNTTSMAAPSPAPAPPPPEPPRPLLVDGMPNFPAVFDSAGIPPDQRDQVQKAQDLLTRLPPGTTPMKRKIVEATLGAFALEMRDVVGAAKAHIDALDAYVDARRRMKQKAIDDGDARVRELQNQIAEARAHTEWAVASEESKEDAALAEIARLEPVISFFLQSEVAEPIDIVESGPSDTAPAASPVEEDPVLVDLYEEDGDDVELDLDPDTGPEEELPSDDRVATVDDGEPAPFEPELPRSRPVDDGEGSITG